MYRHSLGTFAQVRQSFRHALPATTLRLHPPIATRLLSRGRAHFATWGDPTRQTHFITWPPQFPARPWPRRAPTAESQAATAEAPSTTPAEYGWGDWAVASLVSSVVVWPFGFAIDLAKNELGSPSSKKQSHNYEVADMWGKLMGLYLQYHGAGLYVPRAWWLWRLTLLPALPANAAGFIAVSVPLVVSGAELPEQLRVLAERENVTESDVVFERRGVTRIALESGPFILQYVLMFAGVPLHVYKFHDEKSSEPAEHVPPRPPVDKPAAKGEEPGRLSRWWARVRGRKQQEPEPQVGRETYAPSASPSPSKAPSPSPSPERDVRPLVPDFDEAEAKYRKAIERAPKKAGLHWNLSLLLEKRGDVKGAIRETQEYIRKGDPDNDGEARLQKLRAKQ